MGSENQREGRPPNGVYWIKTPVELRAFVNILKKFRGYATTLITLYINSETPPFFDIGVEHYYWLSGKFLSLGTT